MACIVDSKPFAASSSVATVGKEMASQPTMTDSTLTSSDSISCCAFVDSVTTAT